MPLPARLRSTLTVSLTVAVVVLLIPAPAHAGPVDGLCAMNESRGEVPATFAADACVDGSAIWVRNRLRFVVPLRTSGDVLSVTRTSTDYGVAATVTRMIYPDSLVLTPGDTLKVAIGHGAATVGLGLDDGHVIEFHAVASAVEPFIPLPKLAQLGKAGYDILAAFLKDVLEATEDYVVCLHTKNWLGQFACVQPYVTALLQAGERSGIKALAETTRMTAAIVKSFDIIELFESVRAYFEKIGFGEPTIKQAAVGTTSAPQPPTSTPSPPGSAGPSAPAAPSNVTLTPLSGTVVRIRWTDNSNNEVGFNIFTNIPGWDGYAPANSTSFDWTEGLSPGTQLCVQMQAVGQSGLSPLTPRVCATTPSGPQSAPTITGISSYVEDQLVLAHVTYTDANGDATGFGFRGVNGTGFAEETHSFANPSYGRVGPGYVDYPFNLQCGTPAASEADLEFWIYDATGLVSAHQTAHLTC